MNWYAAESLIEDDLERFVKLANSAKLPIIQRHIARRIAESESPETGIEMLVRSLGEVEDASRQHNILDGLLKGLEGRRSLRMPAEWPTVYAKLKALDDETIVGRAFELALLFDDPIALAKLAGDAADNTVDEVLRRRALEALVAKGAENVFALAVELLDDDDLCRDAIRAIGSCDNPATAETLLKRYASFAAEERHDALQTLASRPTWAAELLDAFESEQLSITELTAYTARQLHSLGDDDLAERVRKLWGEVRPTAEEKTKLINGLRSKLTPNVLASADHSAGRAVFEKSCANCHRLYDAGGAIGPDITGAQRTNLDYLLENLIDPSAAVANDYQMERIETVSGRIVTGLVIAETTQALTLQTVSEKIVIPLGEVDVREKSPLSIMPEGLLTNLSADEVRDLVAYLSGTEQVPLPADAEASATSHPAE